MCYWYEIDEDIPCYTCGSTDVPVRLWFTEVDNGFALVTQFEYSDCPVCWQQVMEEAA